MTLETFLAGVLLALLFTEWTGLSPGGIVVPGYIALHLDQPGRILATLAVALICLGIYRLAASFLILFGRRRFVFFLLAGMVLAQVWTLVAPGVFPGQSVELRVIGWVIPGLLANSLERQSIAPTLSGLAVVAVMAHLLIKVVEVLAGR